MEKLLYQDHSVCDSSSLSCELRYLEASLSSLCICRLSCPFRSSSGSSTVSTGPTNLVVSVTFEFDLVECRVERS
jgi:hypothetical protein